MSSGQGRAAPATHAPWPSHALSVSLPFAQLVAHALPLWYAHDPRVTPSHAPAHGVPAPAHAPRDPCGAPTTGKHVPGAVATSHASHAPVHAKLQQTPSAQTPLVHSSGFAHDSPLLLRATHMPSVQYADVVHCASVVHVAGHVPFVQRKNPHDTPLWFVHTPAPSQTSPLTVLFAVSHALGPHVVPGG
jgi:hypothetical protein